VIAGKADWIVFNEIFVENLYDRPIQCALDNCSLDNTLNVLDLGANVGFFTLRLVGLIYRSSAPKRSFVVNCVEGSPQVYSELHHRISINPGLHGYVHLHHGLVGRRDGVSDIYESSFGAGNSTTPQHWSKPTTVPFIDLNNFIASESRIDLLKCDIEGSEQEFQDNYAELLRRTELAVVEIHHAHIDAAKFDDGMAALGFRFRDLLWNGEIDRASVVAYGRNHSLTARRATV
jgi:FkbM family methyltransferase